MAVAEHGMGARKKIRVQSIVDCFDAFCVKTMGLKTLILKY